MLEFIVIGDPHLEKISKFFPPIKALNYQLNAIDRVYNYAVDRGIGYIIIPGDIFETSNPEQSTIRKFLHFLGSRKKVQWHLTRGNHDIHSLEVHSLDVLKGIQDLALLPHVHTYLSPELVTIDDVPLLFLPYPYQRVKKWLKPEDFAVVFPHIGYQGAIMDNGKIHDDGPKISKGKAIYISGHLHTMQKLGKRLYYPGTLYQCNIVEKQEKYFLHVTVEDEKPVLKFVPFDPPFKLFNLVISTDEDLQKIDLKSENFRYRLVVKKGVKLPTKLLDSPNILGSPVGYVNNTEKENVIKGVLSLTQTEREQFSPTFGLDNYLEMKGHDRKTIKKVMKEAKKLEKRIDYA